MLFLPLIAAVVAAGFVLVFFAARVTETVNDGWEYSLLAASIRKFGWLMAGIALLVFFNVNLLGLSVAVAAIAITLIQRRFAEQDALLWILALSARRQMPLAPAVAAYAFQCRGLYRVKVQRLEELLRAGLPLADAVARLRGLLPAAGVAAAAVGVETGTLARTLADEAACRARHRGVWQSVVLRVAYLGFVVGVLVFMTTAMMIWIVPEFVMIFEDFAVDLPWLTLMVMAVSYRAAVWGPVLLSIMLGCMALVFGVPYLWGGSIGSIPVVGRIVRHRHGAAVLRALAVVVETGRPLETGLEILARAYPVASVWPRLRKAEQAVAAGAACWQSLARVGLIGAGDVPLLESAQRVGNLPWALREVAGRTERRISYRVQGWSQVLFPLAVMAVAAIVALLIVGLMLPLVSLIESGTQW